MAKAKYTEDPLVAQVFDADKNDKVLDAIKQLSSEEAEYFLFKLECAIRKRKIQISGYLAAMFVWAVGTFLALIYFGTHEGFTGWAFLAPFAAVGLVLFAFGKWAEKVGKTTLPEAKIAACDSSPSDASPSP